MTETAAPTPALTFVQSMKAHGITLAHSSLYDGHSRTTLALDGEVIGWVERFPEDRAWSATAKTGQGNVDRGDWHATKGEAMNEVIGYVDGGLRRSIWSAVR